ncbi:glycosyltransferase [Limibacter armeniacum]|uniref:glycosyltransferase n=1 Tax=Limibacter armeniacum TaxID=466084 RepID=UPI002FE658F2
MKKVLMISYYWPPNAGVAVLRCLKIAKYLREYGWEPVIYTAENPDWAGIDNSNLKDIPEGITVIKQPIFEPYKYYRTLMGKKKDENVINALVANDDKESLLHKFSVWVRSNFFIPDARAFWIKPSVKYLTTYLKENPVDAIWSSGPPHTNNAIACELKKLTGLPWLSDFQDPWTQVDYFQKLRLAPWGRAKHHRMEQDVFKWADRITIVSDQWNKDLKEIGAKEVSTVALGYDEADYKDLKQESDQQLTLVHMGLMGDDRHPSALLEVIKELSEEREDWDKVFRLKLIGEVDAAIKQHIESLGIGHLVGMMGYVPREEALQICASSQLLLLLLNQAENAGGRIPAKLFEYLAVKRPIICIGDTTGDAVRMVRDAEAGYAFEYGEKDALKQVLTEMQDKYRMDGKVPATKGIAEQYSNQQLTGKVAGLLDEITL